MDPNRAGLLVFLLIIMLLTPESASPGQRLAFQEFLKAQKSRRDVMLNSTFDEGPVDLEGISNPPIPYEIQSIATELWDSQLPEPDSEDEISFYHNITGLMRGEWNSVDMGLSPVELPRSSEYLQRQAQLDNTTGTVMWESSADNRNITESEGIMTFDISESRSSGSIQLIEV